MRETDRASVRAHEGTSVEINTHRYCSLNSSGTIPINRIRVNSGRSNPSCWALLDITVGGSCMSSPAITTLSAPRVSAINVDGCVACVASSTNTTRNS